MANYVHNYLFCNSIAKDKLFSLDHEYVYVIARCHGETIIELGDNSFLVMFDTRGMEYHTDFIKKFITEFKDTKWYCIEENEMEQGCYIWDADGINFSKRNLVETLPGKEIRIKHSDSEHRPFFVVFISDKQMVIEDYINNKMSRYIWGENSARKIIVYIDSLMASVQGDFIEYSIPFKNRIERTIDIHWNDKALYIDSFNEDDGVIFNSDEGEELFNNIMAFFENVLHDEGIDVVLMPHRALDFLYTNRLY